MAYQLEVIAEYEDAVGVVSVAMDAHYLAILSRTPPFVQIWKDASPVAQWGTRGQGPGELTFPVAICLRGEEVWVLNKLPNRIGVFSLDGTLLKNLNLDQADFVAGMKAAGKLVVVQDGGLYKTPNRLFAIEGESMRLLGTLDMGELLTVQGNPSGPPLSVLKPYGEREFWDLAGPQTLVTYGPVSGMSLRDADYQTLESWQLPRKPYLIPDRAQQWWVDTNFPVSAGVPNPGWRREGEKVPMPTTFPQVLKLIVDGASLWILRAYLKDGQRWECYQKQTLVATATFPFTSTTHLIHNRVVAQSDPEQEKPLTLFRLKEQPDP